MVGIIQKVLMNLLMRVGGEDTVAAVLKKAGVPEDHNFRIDTVYSDDEWNRLLVATMEVLKVDDATALKLYAEEFFNYAKSVFPVWFKMSKNSYQFLMRQPQVHSSFAASVSNKEDRKSIEDKFLIETYDLENRMVTHYRSQNKLCKLYKFLAQQTIDHYQDEATITETKCQHNNDHECEIHITWQKFNTQPS